MSDFDLILAGGGLANGLIALRLAQVRPELRVAIVEGAERIGGNHTWSSFDADMTPAQRGWTDALYEYRWPGYSVAFPKLTRRVATGYASATSERLDAAVRAAVPAERLLTGVPVAALDATSVTLADQRRVTARAVLDGRGQQPTPHLDLRWQKFVGLEVETEAAHGLAEPIIMDATVPQLDGYRFVYTLPLGPRRLLIEDTYFADGAEMTVEALETRIRDYALMKGWAIARVVRREVGVLPMAVGGDIAALWDEGVDGVAQVGLRAALFQPATGYSFPDAVALADKIASLKSFDAATIYAAVREHSVARWRERGFYRMLNKMLFVAAEPDERYRVLERFYRLDEGLVQRFYAGRSTLADKARILIGKPPVPVGRAVRALMKG